MIQLVIRAIFEVFQHSLPLKAGNGLQTKSGTLLRKLAIVIPQTLSAIFVLKISETPSRKLGLTPLCFDINCKTTHYKNLRVSN